MYPAVAAGRVSISQYYGVAVRVLTAGDAFGETALDSSAPRNATVLTAEPTELLRLVRPARCRPPRHPHDSLTLAC